MYSNDSGEEATIKLQPAHQHLVHISIVTGRIITVQALSQHLLNSHYNYSLFMYKATHSL